MRGAAAVVLALLLASLACGAGSSSTPQLEPGDGEQPDVVAAKCKALDVDATLTTFAGGECPWALTRDESVLELASLDLDAKPAIEGDVPPSCASAPCDWSGRATTVGPLVIAMPKSAASEMAAGVMMGFVGGDGKLVFVDLWEGAGDPVFDEGTELGPTHGLAPFDCAGKLGLFAVARTEGGSAVSSVASLRAREGVYTAGVPSTVDRKRCKPIAWRMP